MGFLGFYLIALIPAAIGFALWLFSHKFALWEWAATTAIALATAGIIHALTIHGMTADEEVWSGQDSGSWKSDDPNLKEVAGIYVTELGPEVQPYVAPTC